MSEPGEIDALIDALYPVLSHFEVRAVGSSFECTVRMVTRDGKWMQLGRECSDPCEGSRALLTEAVGLIHKLSEKRTLEVRQGTRADEVAHALQTLLACLRSDGAWTRRPETGSAIARATAALQSLAFEADGAAE